MNAVTKEAPMVQNADGTYRYAGTMQWPMTPKNQRDNGLLARVNRSIHPRHWKDGKTAKHHRGAATEAETAS